MPNKKLTFKFWTGQLHLWLGLISGLMVVFMGITGCILAYEREIEDFTQDYRFVESQNKPKLLPSQLKKIADAEFPGKKSHSVSYQDGRSAIVAYYNEEPEYYCLVFLDPYTGKVLKAKDMADDFFSIIIDGHYYLWLPPAIGQPVIATGTLIFFVLLISGIVLWWPKNKAAAKQRFTIKLNAKWRRVNYDMHNVLGFYMAWIGVFLAITGLVMGFQWFAGSVYWTISGGKKIIPFTETFSNIAKPVTASAAQPAVDRLYLKVKQENPSFDGIMDFHFPENKKSSIEVAMNPDPGTYWQADYLYYDQYSLKEIPVKHIYGKLKDNSTADKIYRMNYDIHVGAIAGLAGKTLAFFASLICASMPITGFIIWWGRRNKTAKKTTRPAKGIQHLSARKAKYEVSNS